MFLEFFHVVKFLHISFVAMVTVFPWQQGYLLTYITIKNICAKHELEILSFC